MIKHFISGRLLYRISGHLDNKYPYFSHIHYFLNNYRHKYVMHNIKYYLFDSLTTIKNLNIRCDKFSYIIWIFWWQGIEHMPNIIKKCIYSIKKNSGVYKVILLDKNNLKKYVHLPNYIYKKTMRGYISLIEFSDILRYNLLMLHGGVWIDSTNYCTNTINSSYFKGNNLLITSGCPNHYDFYISNKWAESLIGGYKNESLFIFMDLFFTKYWRHNNYLISYNLVDYALYFAYQHNIGNFKYYVDEKSLYNNPKMFELIKYMNLPYDVQIYRRLISNTHIFKLTYKQDFINNINKKNTFYFKIIHNQL